MLGANAPTVGAGDGVHMSRDLTKVNNGIESTDTSLRTTWHAPEGNRMTSEGKSGRESGQRRLHRESDAQQSLQTRLQYPDL